MTNQQYREAVKALALMFATIKAEDIRSEVAVDFLMSQFNISTNQAFDVVRDALIKAGF